MSAKFILMCGEMVVATFERRKNQTRRLIDPQPIHAPTAYAEDSWMWNGHHTGWDALRKLIIEKNPYGQPGDRLWVKENAWMWCEKVPNGKTKTGRDKFKYVPLQTAQVLYRVDHPEKPKLQVVSPDRGNEWGWRMKVGRFMPRWACRILLEIVSVRVERLREITDSDALAEGVTDYGLGMRVPTYAELWERINGKGSWDKNPFVRVIEFKRV